MGARQKISLLAILCNSAPVRNHADALVDIFNECAIKISCVVRSGNKRRAHSRNITTAPPSNDPLVYLSVYRRKSAIRTQQSGRSPTHNNYYLSQYIIIARVYMHRAAQCPSASPENYYIHLKYVSAQLD
jgi:hypothetical protein